MVQVTMTHYHKKTFLLEFLTNESMRLNSNDIYLDVVKIFRNG